MDTQTDFLIVGSGIAGLMYALKVADHGTVAIVTKKQAVDSNTNLAQGASRPSLTNRILLTCTSGTPWMPVTACAIRTWSTRWWLAVPSESGN
jgi:glycine/D-amino acid oxidase-like deaminating enzyme